MRLEDEFLFDYLGGSPEEVLSWSEFQRMADMLTSFMSFLEDKEWIEDWSEEEETAFGEMISAIVQCQFCNHEWSAHFHSDSDVLECPACHVVGPYKIL